MAPALVLSAPVGLPLALGLDLCVLHLERLNDLCLARFQCLVGLCGELEHLFFAHCILTQVACRSISDVSRKLTCELLAKPLLEGRKARLLLLELSDLIADDRQ